MRSFQLHKLTNRNNQKANTIKAFSNYKDHL